MNKNDNAFGLLTGGLGNQLFQYSFLLTRGKKNNYLVSKWGKPRTNSSNEPEIASFELDESCKVLNPNLDFALTRKSIGYLLRAGYAPKKWENKFIQVLAQLIVSFQVSIGLGRTIIAKAHNSLGFSTSHDFPFSCFHIGYFQSYKWAEESDIFKKLMKLKLKNQQNVLDLKNEADELNPVIIHFRFGDYLEEELFGIPSIKYYESAVEAINSFSTTNRHFWVFSDEIEKARESINLLGIESVRYFNSDQFSPSETLEVMRFGSDFIIANSTFSWWAAFLRYNRGGRVISPTPWFKRMSGPNDLVPESWIQLPSQF